METPFLGCSAEEILFPKNSNPNWYWFALEEEDNLHHEENACNTHCTITKHTAISPVYSTHIQIPYALERNNFLSWLHDEKSYSLCSREDKSCSQMGARLHGDFSPRCVNRSLVIRQFQLTESRVSPNSFCCSKSLRALLRLRSQRFRAIWALSTRIQYMVSFRVLAWHPSQNKAPIFKLGDMVVKKMVGTCGHVSNAIVLSLYLSVPRGTINQIIIIPPFSEPSWNHLALFHIH